MFDDVYLSIALLAGSCFLLGVAVTIGITRWLKKMEDEAYYRECERDFYRGESRAPDGEPF